jgi:hypothetical protein
MDRRCRLRGTEFGAVHAHEPISHTNATRHFEMTDASNIINMERPAADGPCTVTNAIRDALAILDAIGQGGLFEGMPISESERRRHKTGVALLDLLEDRLRQAVGGETHLDSVDCRYGGNLRLHAGKQL